MEVERMFGTVFLTGMIAGVLVIYMAIRQRSEFLEMQHRERMAMIERGMTPASPAGGGRATRARGVAAPRFMTLGIIVAAVGLALMTLLSLAAGVPDVGMGVGGAIMIVGAAFIVNSLVTRNMAPAPPDQLSSPPPPLPPFPPNGVE